MYPAHAIDAYHVQHVYLTWPCIDILRWYETAIYKWNNAKVNPVWLLQHHLR